MPPRNFQLEEVPFSLEADGVNGSLDESYLVIDGKGNKCAHELPVAF